MTQRPLKGPIHGERDQFAQIPQHMVVGQPYEAVVESVSVPANTCQVRLKLTGVPVYGCVWAAGIVSGMMGFRTTYVPPVKTEVVVVNLGNDCPPCITGCLPGQIEDTHAPSRPSVSSEDNYHTASKFGVNTSGISPVWARHKPPIDLIEGEFQMDNMMGVALSLLRGLARLQAGGLASVECHLLNDMVRIVSDTFRHYTAFGDYEIKNDGGRLDVEWHGTSHDHEAWGQQKEDKPKATLKDGNRIDTTASDGFSEEGRWRFSQYIGWVGDFINMFVTDPQEQIGKIAADQFRSGKARVNIGSDGGYLIQSVSEIIIEKVVRIPVPIQVKVPGDPTDNQVGENLKTSSLRNWVPSDKNNIFETVFQLREYTRWLSNQYTLGRFRQLDKRYQIPSEAETPAPDLYSKESDRQTENQANSTSNLRTAYATMRIYRDGSIQHLDAYGNSYTSSQNGVTVSSTTDLRLEAAGQVFIVGGKGIHLLSKGGINLTSIADSVRIKCGKVMELFSPDNVVINAGRILQMTSKIGLAIMNCGAGFLRVVGGLNVANVFGVNAAAGTAGVAGEFSALRISAVDTQVLDGEEPHEGHLWPGYNPSLPSGSKSVIGDTSEDPATIDSSSNYESMSQQFIRVESDPDQYELWDMSQLKVGDKPIPWPTTQKVFKTMEKLSTPSAKKAFDNKPSTAMVSTSSGIYIRK